MSSGPKPLATSPRPTDAGVTSLRLRLCQEPILQRFCYRRLRTGRPHDLSAQVRRSNARRRARHHHIILAEQIRREGQFGRCALLLYSAQTSPRPEKGRTGANDTPSDSNQSNVNDVQCSSRACNLLRAAETAMAGPSGAELRTRRSEVSFFESRKPPTKAGCYSWPFLRSAKLITLDCGSRLVKSASASAFTSRPVRLTKAV